MGNQTTTDGSEDSSHDYVSMILWTYVPGVGDLVLDFLGIRLWRLCSPCTYSVFPTRGVFLRAAFVHTNFSYPALVQRRTSSVILRASFWKDIFQCSCAKNALTVVLYFFFWFSREFANHL
jgi:hypothetical protein